MPYEYVEPELFVTLPIDKKVYHCYRDQDDVLLCYHYQIPSDRRRSGWTAFDVRDLKHEQGLTGMDLSHREIIEMAAEAFLPKLEDTLDQLDLWYEGAG